MKRKNAALRGLSMLLCALLLCGVIPRVSAAAEGGYAIESARMPVGETRAQVTYTAAGSAMVIAALYDTATLRMLAAGSAVAAAGGGTVDVPMPLARQAGCELRAFLVDAVSGAPLSDSYSDYGEERYASAREYYENNVELLEVIEAEGSGGVLDEAEARAFLEGRGFGGRAVTYKYSITGQLFDETAIEEVTSARHPMYRTVYASANGDVWLVYVINNSIFAYPFSFNLESDLEAELIFSESDTLTSYDCESNQFFVTVPHASEMIVRTVDAVNAETLDSLTVEEICRLSGASVPAVTAGDGGGDGPFSDGAAGLADVTLSAGKYTEEDPFIVVSLGDSYSSGEGIEEPEHVAHFYGQDKPLSEKVHYYDWLAHRSELGWPGRITVPGTGDALSSYHVPFGEKGSGAVQWYFGAVSGAQTKNFNYEANDVDTKNGRQKKHYNKTDVDGKQYTGDEWHPNQLDIFDCVSDLGDVDYVTLTMGGNDVGFVTVIATCCVEPTYLEYLILRHANVALESKLNSIWDNIDSTMENIKGVYKAIHEKVPNAVILVAGYPKLLDKDGKGLPISENEASLVNEKVSALNGKIRELVESCEKEYHTYFVDVEPAFDADGGHQAYSKNNWINPVWLMARPEDLEVGLFGFGPSSYSMHPNARGAQAYADEMNETMRWLEARSALWGEWDGEYDGWSGGGLTRRHFAVTVSECNRDGEISGTVVISPSKQTASPYDENGSYYFSGNVDFSTGDVSFRGHTWTAYPDAPGNHTFFTFDGTVSRDAAYIGGIVAGDSSRTFELKRVDPDKPQGPGAVPAAAPDDAVYFGGHAYKAFTESITWEEAELACEALGGHLVTITSSGEQQFVNGLAEDRCNLFWIGLRRSAGDPEGWTWVTNEPLFYTNWGYGEPNEAFDGTEFYAQMYGRPNGMCVTGHWNDSKNTSGTVAFYMLKNVGYICEWD